MVKENSGDLRYMLAFGCPQVSVGLSELAKCVARRHGRKSVPCSPHTHIQMLTFQISVQGL